MVLTTCLRNAAKRVPMIKFRAGNKHYKQEAIQSLSSHETVSAKPSVSINLLINIDPVEMSV